MAESGEIPKTKICERYPRDPKDGPLKSLKVSLEGYWTRFERSSDGERVILRDKGETLNSRAFNVSIPREIYMKMYRRAICEFKPACPVGGPAKVGGLAKQETAPKPPPVKPEPGNLF